MMRTILKRDVRILLGAPLWLLTIIYILFCIGERQGTSDSYEVFVLRMLTEHYLLIYCMTPIFLLSIFRSLEDDTPFLIIRFRKFSHYFYSKWLAILTYAFLFVLLQLTIVAIMGIGLPLESGYPMVNSVENELVLQFQSIFTSPLEAIVSVSMYMIVGLAFIGMSILTIFHFFDRKLVTVVIILTYGIMYLSIKIPPLSYLPFLTINRYIILHHNFMYENGVLYSVIGMISLFSIQIVLIRFFWYRSFSITWNLKMKGLFMYYARALWTRKNIALLLGILVLLTSWKSATGVEESIQDYVIRFFFGMEIGSFHFIPFLEQIIYYGTPLYLFAIFLENGSTDHQMHVFIRSRKKKTWLYATITNGIILHIVYVGLNFAFLFMIGVSTDKLSFMPMIPIFENTHHSIWTIFVCLKILELSVLFLSFILLFVWLKNVTAAYIMVMSMHGLSLIDTIFSPYNPAGLGTISRLQVLEGSSGMSLTQAFLLLGIEFILLLILISLSYKRYFK